MAIYIAGTSREPQIAYQVAITLGKHGFNCLHAWTNSDNIIDKPEKAIWMQCLAQINRSDAIVVCSPTVPTIELRGAIFELGYAIAKGKPAFIIDPNDTLKGDWYQSPGIVGIYKHMSSLLSALEPLK